MPDEAISVKFVTPRVSAESSGDLSKNCFGTIFGSHLEFLHEKNEIIYLQNGARLSHCSKIFDPQGIPDLHEKNEIIYLQNGARLSHCSKIFDPQGIPDLSGNLKK